MERPGGARESPDGREAKDGSRGLRSILAPLPGRNPFCGASTGGSAALHHRLPSFVPPGRFSLDLSAAMRSGIRPPPRICTLASWPDYSVLHPNTPRPFRPEFDETLFGRRCDRVASESSPLESPEIPMPSGKRGALPAKRAGNPMNSGIPPRHNARHSAGDGLPSGEK
jgi:hypothetical protein